MKEKILKQFIDNEELYKKFTEACSNIINELIITLPTHQITKRIKTKESLSRKIDAKNWKYNDISDITDICWIRIITYFDSDVEKISKVIEKEFKIDWENSIDKRISKSNQFWYKSLHYVVSLNNERVTLPEYSKYHWLKIEIQIRSVLQHAWAEIEHDLWYKWEFEIPENFKRNFSRLSALLEITDIEFDRLKKELREYEEKIDSNIIKMPSNISIDKISLWSYINSNLIFKELMKIITDITNCTFYEVDIAEIDIKRCIFLGLNTIWEINEILEKDKTKYIKFTISFISWKLNSFKWETELPSTLPLLYLQHYIASSKNNIGFLKNYFTEWALWWWADEEYFLSIFNKINN